MYLLSSQSNACHPNGLGCHIPLNIVDILSRFKKEKISALEIQRLYFVFFNDYPAAFGLGYDLSDSNGAGSMNPPLPQAERAMSRMLIRKASFDSDRYQGIKDLNRYQRPRKRRESESKGPKRRAC